MLHAQSITLRRDGRRILDNVSLSVMGGELVALLGSSGAGKSTLLSTLAGDLDPDAGEAWLGGRKVSDWSLRDRALRRAVLPQSHDANLPLTALDVVRMGRAPHIRLTESQQDRAICRAALRWVEAEHLQTRHYPTLSGGERQQIQLARVLAQVWGRAAAGDCYVFFDEPCTGLDLREQHRMVAVARQLAHEGAAVVMVLHDVNLAAQHADRLVLLRGGKVLADGAPRDVLVPRTLEDTFGVEVDVTAHPRLALPLVVPLGALAQG